MSVYTQQAIIHRCKEAIEHGKDFVNYTVGTDAVLDQDFVNSLVELRIDFVAKENRFSIPLSQDNLKKYLQEV